MEDISLPDSSRGTLSCLMWNVGGFKSKLQNQSCKDYITSFDVMFFVESWADDGENIFLPGYKCFERRRARRYRVGRPSGGIVEMIYHV